MQTSTRVTWKGNQLCVRVPMCVQVMTWTGEFSERCKPAWCVENLMAAAMRGDDPSPPSECAC